MKPVSCLWLLAIPSVWVTYTGLVPSERESLVALYHHTDGPGWFKADNWLSGDPCGTGKYICGQSCGGWYGVHCHGPDGHVRMLKLANNGLNGVLPTELGNLQELGSLILSKTMSQKWVGAGAHAR